jgi:hypothetical protein
MAHTVVAIARTAGKLSMFRYGQPFTGDTPDRTSPPQAVLFALNMLVGTEAGSTYGEAEYASWLDAAGFEAVRRVRLRSALACRRCRGVGRTCHE